MAWYLIFERAQPVQSPGAVATSGLFGGSRHDPPTYRAFKCLMVLEVSRAGPPGAKDALYAAARLSGTIGDYFAVEVDMRTIDVLPPERPDGA